MTSILSSLFQSASSQLSSRIENFRAVEAALLAYARKFEDLRYYYTASINDYRDLDHTHSVTVFDTKIPRSSVSNDKIFQCQIKKLTKSGSGKHLSDSSSSSLCCSDSDKDEDADDTLIIHAFKVSSNVHDKIHDDPKSKLGVSRSPLVLLHGYANSSLNFYRNVLGLAHGHFGTVYAVDLLGWGLSSRPPMPEKPFQGMDELQTTESFFVESLEAWRRANDIPTMILGGHSMGGYLSVAYTERYPQHVEKLILISPVGIPHEEDTSAQIKQLPFRVRMMISFFSFLWTSGMTPSSLIRKVSDDRGRKLTSAYVDRRLVSVTSQDEKDSLRDYLYYNSALPGSGEYCLSKILKPMAFAKKPAVDRIPQLKVRDVAFLYGEHDWMDYRGGLDVQRKCDELKNQGHEHVPNVTVYGVKDAGHMLMLDNWQEFNNALIMAAGAESKLASDAPKPFLARYDSQEDFFQVYKFRHTRTPSQQKAQKM